MFECDFRDSWLLDSGMIPAILEGGRTNTLPGLLCHHHCLEKVYFINILLTSIVSLNRTEAKLTLIVGFEAANNSSIKRLDMGCETRPKVEKCYIFGFILNGMAGKVVQSESNVAVFQLQFDIPFLYAPKV